MATSAEEQSAAAFNMALRESWHYGWGFRGVTEVACHPTTFLHLRRWTGMSRRPGIDAVYETDWGPIRFRAVRDIELDEFYFRIPKPEVHLVEGVL